MLYSECIYPPVYISLQMAEYIVRVRIIYAILVLNLRIYNIWKIVGKYSYKLNTNLVKKL